MGFFDFLKGKPTEDLEKLVGRNEEPKPESKLICELCQHPIEITDKQKQMKVRGEYIRVHKRCYKKLRNSNPYDMLNRAKTTGSVF